MFCLQNTQDTSWGWLWVLKISSKVWVLKQTQSAMLCRVSHMTILTMVIWVMNVWNQPCESFITCLSPFCDWSCQFVHGPQDVRSSNSCQIQAFQDNLWANFWKFSNWFQLLLFELMVVQTRMRNFVKFLHFLVCQFTVSLKTFLSMSFHVVWPRCDLCVRFLPSL